MRMRLTWLVSVVLFAVVVSGCPLLDGGGGGGDGTGGGAGSFTFTQGFAFVRKDDRNVYLVNDADPNTTTTLTSTGTVRTPAFSRDGKRLVFVRGGTADAELATVALEGGLATTVLASTPQAKNFKTPQFSPDGTRIVFGFDEGTVANVGIVNVDGSGFEKLASGGLAQGFPSFTPDGTAVLTAAGGAGLAFTQLQLVTLATNTVAPVTNTLGNEAMAIMNRVQVSPDGTKAAFDARVSSGSTRLFVIDLSTRVVTSPFAGDANTNDTFPVWMNATTLAFSSDSGGSDNVYRVGLAGDSATLLVPKAIEPAYFAP